ncbi:MAG: Gfo/Idh/MocA family oxidoreductase [Geminicoccaceae bacterium]|nr:Gfo/Idh/MocA family oxidoreductase [Geminicoccaceae bacterium]MCX8100853.1 Gfo/Idh/MocA family oxidoreductase [Geminicoccaceae bacterium]MDW8370514.1 Gfo/Idh/MocA family oxidoreductase [Geminicoccaceae bacterium]
MARVSLAIVGYGLIGREHVRRAIEEPRARLAAIVEPDPAAAAAASAHGVPVLASLAELVDRRLAEGVVLATPTALHAEQAVTCLEAGLPVLVEKPLAHDLDAGRRIVEAAARTGVPVLVGHHRRHSPWIRAAKTVIEQGTLGRILLVDALTWLAKPEPYFAPAWRRRKGAGPVLTNLVHVIDDLRNLVGEIVEVRALASNALRGFETEDTAVVLLRFDGGALGTVSVSDGVAAPWSWEHGSGENPWFPRAGEACYRIGGTRAALALPGLELWRHEGDRGWMAPLECLRRTVAEDDPLALELRHFCAVVRGEERPVLDAAGGLATLAATLAVLEAADGDTAVRPAGAAA